MALPVKKRQNEGVSSPAALPPENPGLFLAVRRGLPLGLSAMALVAALLEPMGRGWYLLLAVAFLAEVGPTFRRGRRYLAHRATITRWDGFWVRAFRPLFRTLGREEAWLLAFCDWNNLRVREAFETRPAQRALVLLPHCIQLARCKAEVVEDLSACYKCGLCPVEDVLEGTLTRQWQTRLSNRSHKAYREAREYRPDLIVAVSCTDRLLKGLTKLPEIPSFVIPLALPHGMCVDTTFPVPHLMAAMEALVERQSIEQQGEKIIPLRAPGVA